MCENCIGIQLWRKEKITIINKASNQLGGNLPKYGKKLICLLWHQPKLVNHIAYGPAIPLLGIHPEMIASICQKTCKECS